MSDGFERRLEAQGGPLKMTARASDGGAMMLEAGFDWVSFDVSAAVALVDALDGSGEVWFSFEATDTYRSAPATVAVAEAEGGRYEVDVLASGRDLAVARTVRRVELQDALKGAIQHLVSAACWRDGAATRLRWETSMEVTW